MFFTYGHTTGMLYKVIKMRKFHLLNRCFMWSSDYRLYPNLNAVHQYLEMIGQAFFWRRLKIDASIKHATSTTKGMYLINIFVQKSGCIQFSDNICCWVYAAYRPLLLRSIAPGPAGQHLHSAHLRSARPLTSRTYHCAHATSIIDIKNAY